MRFVKFLLVTLAVGLGAWIARLLAHSKVPLPEGSWREIPMDELERRK